jgi:hypothetical protein
VIARDRQGRIACTNSELAASRQVEHLIESFQRRNTLPQEIPVFKKHVHGAFSAKLSWF